MLVLLEKDLYILILKSIPVPPNSTIAKRRREMIGHVRGGGGFKIKYYYYYHGGGGGFKSNIVIIMKGKYYKEINIIIFIMKDDYKQIIVQEVPDKHFAIPIMRSVMYVKSRSYSPSLNRCLSPDTAVRTRFKTKSMVVTKLGKLNSYGHRHLFFGSLPLCSPLLSFPRLIFTFVDKARGFNTPRK